MVRGWVWDFRCGIIRSGLTEKMTCESRLGGGEETGHEGFAGKAFQTEGPVSARVLR